MTGRRSDARLHDEVTTKPHGRTRPGRRDAPSPERREPAPLAELFAALMQGDLLDQGPALYVADLGGRLLWRNAAFRRLAGGDTADAAAEAALLPLAEIAAALRRDGETVVRKDAVEVGGETRLLVSRHGLLRDAAGVPAAIGGAIQATAQDGVARDGARVLRQRLDDVVRLTADWIWETDPALNFTSVSHRVFDILGYHPRELVGRNLLSLAANDQPPTALLRGFAKVAPFRDLAFAAVARSGEKRVISLAAVPVFDPDSGALAGFRGAATDVTALRQHEAGLRAATQAAVMASRAKSEFLANTSHELRTPLNAIIGFSEILKMEMLGPLGSPQYSGYVADIHASAKHLLDLINDILEVSRIEAGQAALHEAATDPRDVVAAAARMIADRAKAAGVRVSAFVDENVPALLADATKLKQILTNLLSNAVKFTPAGGSVTVSARLAPDGDLTIAVADTGIGIGREDLGRIMEPFTQADGCHARKYDGTGLGLPLARGLAELHGGSLSLDSEPGVGTTATLRLPARRLIRG